MTSCLQTREDIKEIEAANAMKDQVSSLQKNNADASTRMEELLEQNRTLTGRLEELEHRLKKNEEQEGSGKEGLNQTLEESKRNNQLLQESVSKLENQLQGLQEEIIALRTKESTKSKNENGDRKNNDQKKKETEKDSELLESALTHFQEKRWKEAILNFDQYREKNPKGKFAAEATYKTGVCFQELGMTEEAKVFFQEVIAKYPKSDMSKKAQYRLKTIK